MFIPDHKTNPSYIPWCEMNGYDPEDPEIQDWWDRS